MKMLDINAQEYINEMRRIRQQKRESMDRKNFTKIQSKKKELIPYENKELNEPLLNSKVPFEKMKTGDMVILNTPFDKNDQNKNLFTITKINFKGKTVTVRRAGVEGHNNPERIIAFERIARHIKVDMASKVNMIQTYRKKYEDWAEMAAINTPEPEYIITDDDIDDIIEVQQKLNLMIPRVILASQPVNDTMVDETANVTQESTMQAVPSASVDLTKLSDESSWFTNAANVVNNKSEKEVKQTMNATEGSKWMSSDTTQFGDYSDYEEITEETLSQVIQPMQLLNASTQNTSEVITYDSEESLVNIEIKEKAQYESDRMVLNSTMEKAEEERSQESKEEDQVLPDLDARPIRARKQTQKFQVEWN